MRTNLAVVGSALVLAGAMIAFSPLSVAQQAPAPGAAPTPQTPQTEPGDEPSEKLDKHEGVLKPPPGVDPKIHKTPPATTGDRMPIIVPPGEPGGDQSVQPK
jgi:hypothetical protein